MYTTPDLTETTNIAHGTLDGILHHLDVSKGGEMSQKDDLRIHFPTWSHFMILPKNDGQILLSTGWRGDSYFASRRQIQGYIAFIKEYLSACKVQ